MKVGNLYRVSSRATLPPHGVSTGNHPPRCEDYKHLAGRQLHCQNGRFRVVQRRGCCWVGANSCQHRGEGKFRIPRPGVLQEATTDGKVGRLLVRCGVVGGFVCTTRSQSCPAKRTGNTQHFFLWPASLLTVTN